MVSDTFLPHWELEFSELYQTQGHQQPFSKQNLIAAASCNLLVSRSPLVTMPPLQTPTNPGLTSASLLTRSNYHSWQTTHVIVQFFPLLATLTLQSGGTQPKCCLNLCLPGYSLQFVSDKTLFYSYYRLYYFHQQDVIRGVWKKLKCGHKGQSIFFLEFF